MKQCQVPFILAYKHAAKWDIIFWGIFDIFIIGLIIGSIFYLIENFSKGHLSAGDLAIAVLIAWDIWYRMAFLSWNLVALSGDLGKMQSALNEFVRPISVEDKEVPKDGKAYLAYMIDLQQDIVSWIFSDNDKKPYFRDYFYKVDVTKKITHWMPLPNQPK